MPEDDGLPRGIRSVDSESVQQAIQTLRDEGFAVDAIKNAERDRHGIVFDLTIFDPNRNVGLSKGDLDAE